MNFKSYIDQAWAQHDKQTANVVQSYSLGLERAHSEDDILAFCRLVLHIAAEHDFNFEAALQETQKIQKSEYAQSPAVKAVLLRQAASLKVMGEKKVDLSSFSISDRSLVFVVAASSFLYRNQFDKADDFLVQSVSASLALPSTDPAFKQMAMSCNNMAAFLSEKSELKTEEKKRMIDFAIYSRNFWEKAGTWLQVERAEYYLSRYFRKISDWDKALKHAELCLQICKSEKAPAVEMFFAHEALALTSKEMNDQFQFEKNLEQMKIFFNQCSESDQSWMQQSLKKAEQ